ncbi:hypothetical protein QTJ16_005299 [Diplocarpon rosae]|uniref:Uncharacterized protein n=1 Tax=Diplocarpon rosae TaxID=946125 RepID=A0AAD9WB42_9HELO|nr:hypothetical protein QTJ16_005299 [Diplocarpon rosae]
MDVPLSPSLSEPSAAPDETQAPLPSIRESLPGYGISIETAEEWKCRYNRQEVRVMGDEEFWELGADIAKESNPAEIQPRLKSSIDQISTRLHDDFEHASYEMLLPGHRLALTEDKKFAFISSLSQDIMIRSIHAFMAYRLPHLIKPAQESKAQLQKQMKAGPVQRRKPKAQKQNNQSCGQSQPLT